MAREDRGQQKELGREEKPHCTGGDDGIARKASAWEAVVQTRVGPDSSPSSLVAVSMPTRTPLSKGGRMAGPPSGVTRRPFLTPHKLCSLFKSFHILLKIFKVGITLVRYTTNESLEGSHVNAKGKPVSQASSLLSAPEPCLLLPGGHMPLEGLIRSLLQDTT